MHARPLYIKEKQRGFSGTEMVIGDGWTCAQYVVEDDVVRAPAGCGVNSKKTISLQATWPRALTARPLTAVSRRGPVGTGVNKPPRSVAPAHSLSPCSLTPLLSLPCSHSPAPVRAGRRSPSLRWLVVDLLATMPSWNDEETSSEEDCEVVSMDMGLMVSSLPPRVRVRC